MTRKDTILIAVVINAGLLAVLFATAIIYDNDKVLDQGTLPTNMVNNVETPPVQEVPSNYLAVAETKPEEVDHVLNTYTAQPVQVEAEAKETEEEKPTEEIVKAEEPEPEYKEVTVKKGDVLEKLAKTHGSTVNLIKKANQLKSESLKIGQVLKIPPKKNKNKKKTEETIASNDDTEGTYHTVKSGDSPWKVAKKYGVEYEDILRLNNMDEEKARNLKIGEKIRVK